MNSLVRSTHATIPMDNRENATSLLDGLNRAPWSAINALELPEYVKAYFGELFCVASHSLHTVISFFRLFN